MNKETIRNFLAWLDQATDEEIQARKKAAIEALGKVSTREGKSDIRLVLRLIDEELIARLEVGSQKSG
jgi:pyridoxine/pyridoxamine 5'-phosphate oxidase